MALAEVKVLVIDLDSVLSMGLEEVNIAVRRAWQASTPQNKKPQYPMLWCWVPHTFSGFFGNEKLFNSKAIDYFLVGDFETGDFSAHQVLLFSRSVHVLLSVREARLCQTIVGDSLSSSLRHFSPASSRFDKKFVLEFSSSQIDYLQNRRRSKIFRYLSAFNSSLAHGKQAAAAPDMKKLINMLNASLWVQERCEGVAILEDRANKSWFMVCTSREGLSEWEAIFKKELEWIPPSPGTSPKNAEQKSAGARNSGKELQRSDSSGTEGGGFGKEFDPDRAFNSQEGKHDVRRKRSMSKGASAIGEDLDLDGAGAGSTVNANANNSDPPADSVDKELAAALAASKADEEKAKARADNEADALAMAIRASLGGEQAGTPNPHSPMGEKTTTGIDLVD